MLSIIRRIFGTANDRAIKKLRSEITKINELEPEMEKLSDAELKAKTEEFKDRLAKGASLDDIAYEAFATVREASKRVLAMRHFDVQLIGGLILHRGMITEMRTGEGKTLVATLPAYLNALSGRGVHIVTTNDYLAKRDSIWMGKLYNFLGLSLSCIIGGLSDEERKEAYNADITHATNNELGFDFLRDNMKFSADQKVQREMNFAIIDEVDSILIDEARTPLIISGPVDDNTDLYLVINKLINRLGAESYEKDEKMKTINLTEEGTNRIEDLLTSSDLIKEGTSLYDFENMSLVHYINQALRANYMFTRDVDYMVTEGKVMIIDEFTGRIMDGRRYSEGLHQALEAKEGVPIQRENQTLASITFQNYFRMYNKLSGMTGTAMTEAVELKDIYNLDVISVPTHHPIKRTDHEDEIYGSKQDKYDAIIRVVEDCHKRGQPVLVGTVSIEKSEELSSLLNKKKITHNVLNAKYHEKEAQIIAQAGRFGAVTIATNMAGRGTDIMLGGNPEMLLEESLTGDTSDSEKAKIAEKIKSQTEEEKERVIAAGGLFVIGTERHESRRIDNQLRGRSGRQGDPGSTRFYLSLDDDLMRIFASDRVSSILRTLGLKDGEAIQHPMISRSLEKAQEKVESHNYEIRKNLLKFDDVMNDQRKVIYEQRNEIISSEDVKDMHLNLLEQVVETLVTRFIPEESYREDWDVEGLSKEAHQGLALSLDPESIKNGNITEVEIIENIVNDAKALYASKEEEYGLEMMRNATKYVLLVTLDQVWKDHLHYLDHLRHGISLRAYGQKDPLNEYKREAFNMFESMLANLRETFIQRISHLHIDPGHMSKEEMSLENRKLQKMEESREDPAFAKYN
ncbi:MAG: preprotein translocase subunit SecA, partial [Rickettsiaceae bacterium]|nr:preprotein translocase subunit SecA [Rickettsiaceae bacterium]